MSPSPGDVSVVTVNWNGKSHLSTLLPPLLALGPGEVIVVDNGSADGSQGFLRKRYPQVRLLENGVNRGFAQPCNLGAETARGSHVAFINNDMRPEPDWLTAALGKLDAQTPCVASRILDWEGRRIDYNGSSLHYLGYGLQEDLGLPVEEAPRRDQVLFPCGGAMLVDRRVFLEVGGFDADFFALFEDVDLGWRLWLAGHRVVMAPDSVVRHRGHATLETQAPEKTRYLMHRNALLTIFKNYDEENFRKIVPLALVLSVKRAVHFSGVRKESFYLWSETRHKLDEGDETARSQLLDSLNHLVAVDDVLQALPGLVEKRRRVQALRRRSDREILELFGDPLRRIVEDPEYVKEELELLEALDLGSLLDLGSSAASLESLPGSLREKIRSLEEELNALRWLGSQATLHPPDPPGLASRFFRTARREGLKVACLRAFDYVNRAV